jgi:hypothetical protein
MFEKLTRYDIKYGQHKIPILLYLGVVSEIGHCRPAK